MSVNPLHAAGPNLGRTKVSLACCGPRYGPKYLPSFIAFCGSIGYKTGRKNLLNIFDRQFCVVCYKNLPWFTVKFYDLFAIQASPTKSHGFP